MTVPVTVSQLAIAPVKGMRLQCVGEVELGRHGMTLGFPDGAVVRDAPEPGARATTRMYDGREIPGRILTGVWCDVVRPGRIHVGDAVTAVGPGQGRRSHGDVHRL